MAALTKDRNTPQAIGDFRNGPVAATAILFAGALLMRNAAGYLLAGATATGMVGVGRVEAFVDNSSGADGNLNVDFRPGFFRFANSAGADEITVAEIGDVAFIVDDQTVAKTDGTSTRSPAGIIDNVDDQGVWVRFDEALTKIAAA